MILSTKKNTFYTPPFHSFFLLLPQENANNHVNGKFI